MSRPKRRRLAQQYTWMMLLLERTDTVEPLEKDKIEERLAMFDQLWDESPRVQRMKEQFRVQGQREAREQAQRDADRRIAEWQRQVQDAQREADRKMIEWQRQAQQEMTERAKIEAEKLQQEMKERAKVEAEKLQQEMKERAKIEVGVLQRALVSMVRVRFPDLGEFAQQRVGWFEKPEVLDLLIQKVATAPDAKAVRWLLDVNMDGRE